MIDTIVVGKNSFLARAYQERFASDKIIFLSHGEALSQADLFKKARIVLNFSFAPSLSTQSYESALDSDSRLANMLGSQTHYVMLSSRMVYGNAQGSLEFFEGMETSPVSVYGQNKLIVERNLANIIAPENLTILRLSNIFGFEPERKTFFGTALTNLYTKNRMTFDISPDSVRDFLPVDIFSDYLCVILKNPQAGIYNIGSGFGISCSDITKWIIEGYEQGEAVFDSTERKGEFFLNVEKAKRTFSLHYDVTISDIRAGCFSCGEKLKRYGLTATA